MRALPDESGTRNSASARLLAHGVAWLLLLAAPAMALDPANALTQYGHAAWRVREGRFPAPPTALSQSTDGYLWIGTQAGLLRFVGVRFEPWSPPPGSRLPDERVFALLGASDGSTWIGTANGLAQWKDGSLTVHATVGRFGSLVEDAEGTMWAGHTRALSELPPLCRMERGALDCSIAVPLRFVSALHERDGHLWIGGEQGACLWRSGQAECHVLPALAGAGDKFGVSALVEDASGTLWVGAGPLGIWQLEHGAWNRLPGSLESGLEAGAMLAEREGAVWLGTPNEGIVRFVQGRTERFSRADGLSGDAVAGLFQDREGNVWVATSAGLDRFRDVEVATLTSAEGLGSGTVHAVAADPKGGVWIA